MKRVGLIELILCMTEIQYVVDLFCLLANFINEK